RPPARSPAIAAMTTAIKRLIHLLPSSRTTAFTCRAGCKEHDVSENQNAGPVKCNALLGGWTNWGSEKGSGVLPTPFRSPFRSTVPLSRRVVLMNPVGVSVFQHRIDP